MFVRKVRLISDKTIYDFKIEKRIANPLQNLLCSCLILTLPAVGHGRLCVIAEVAESRAVIDTFLLMPFRLLFHHYLAKL